MLALAGAPLLPIVAQPAPSPQGLRAMRVMSDANLGFSSPISLAPEETSAAADATRPASTTAILTAPRGQRAPWWAPMASLAIPGSGQAALGQQRSVAYLIAEGYFLVQAIGAQRDVSRGTRDYQNIAASTARRAYGGAFPVGPWEYYEAMEKFDASGQFDVVPGGAVDPETDAATYNGQSWLLARTTFWRDPNSPPPMSTPEYQRALTFYTNRAIRDDFRWSWRDAGLQKDVYRGVISSTNRSNQRKTNLVAVLSANHLASVIDAYINVRIRRSGGVGLAGLTLDGVQTQIGTVGDPADGFKSLRAGLVLIRRDEKLSTRH